MPVFGKVVCHHKQCAEPRGEKIKTKIEQHALTGGLWFAAWLYTIGFLHLVSWQGTIALVIRPYYLGAHLRTDSDRDVWECRHELAGCSQLDFEI